MKVHKLNKFEEQPGNLPQYRWYVECSCGFQARLATEQAAKSQYDNHLMYHGVTPYFSNLVNVVEEEKSQVKGQESKENGLKQLGTPAGSWKPVGAA